MATSPVLPTRYREFFHFNAPVAAVERAVGSSPALSHASRAIVLNIEAGDGPGNEAPVNERVIPLIPFPAASKGLAAIAMDAACYEPGETLHVLLPRSAFDRVADQNGLDRISGLSLSLGAGQGDVVLAHLSASLEHALTPGATSNAAIVDQISLALNLHVAQQYGAMTAPRVLERGGLAPWQLRLARNTFDRNLDGSVSLDGLAAACGLSPSHFSRAFSRSTGVAPHRWLMQRRIEVAKDMIVRRATSLAQIALDCGFADQSHFTRAFTAVTGHTPGRWRAAQTYAYAEGQSSQTAHS